MTELVDTRDFGKHFLGRLNVEVEVTGSNGSVVAIANDSCLVARQLVNIKFTKDTRKYFRPGMPYGGKVGHQTSTRKKYEGRCLITHLIIDIV